MWLRILILVYVSCILAMTGCKTDINKHKKHIELSALNTERAENVTILYSKQGITKAKLKTKTFKQNQTAKPSYIEMPDGLQVTFFDDSVQVLSTLTAKYGKLFDLSNNVLVRDSVVVTNNKNETLQTEELIWNEKLQLFYTDKFVKITTPTQIIYGDGLESNQQFTQYKITNVKGIIGVSKSSLPSQ